MTARQAVILAAGVGSRLRPLTDACPKALIPLGDRPVIAHVLDALVAHGIDSVVVVTGHAAALMSDYLSQRNDVRIVCTVNPAYTTTNTMASVACAATYVDHDFLLIDGDLIFDPALLSALSERGTWIAVDRSQALDSDAVKVAVDDGHIVQIGKQMPAGVRPEAESIGLAKIDSSTARSLFPLCRRMIQAGERQAYYEAAFQRLIEDGFSFRPADVTGYRWVEIDDPEDLRRAEVLFVAR